MRLLFVITHLLAVPGSRSCNSQLPETFPSDSDRWPALTRTSSRWWFTATTTPAPVETTTNSSDWWSNTASTLPPWWFHLTTTYIPVKTSPRNSDWWPAFTSTSARWRFTATTTPAPVQTTTNNSDWWSNITSTLPPWWFNLTTTYIPVETSPRNSDRWPDFTSTLPPLWFTSTITTAPTETSSYDNDHPESNGHFPLYRKMELYESYGLDRKEYSIHYLLDTLNAINDHPHIHVWLDRTRICMIPLLSGKFNTTVTFHELAQEALQLSRWTAFEDLVKFFIANIIDTHLMLYNSAVLYYEQFVEDLGRVPNRYWSRRPFFLYRQHILVTVIKRLGISLILGQTPYSSVQEAIDLFKSIEEAGDTFRAIETRQQLIGSLIDQHLEDGCSFGISSHSEGA